jgi:hypothetical protein
MRQDVDVGLARTLNWCGATPATCADAPLSNATFSQLLQVVKVTLPDAFEERRPFVAGVDNDRPPFGLVGRECDLERRVAQVLYCFAVAGDVSWPLKYLIHYQTLDIHDRWLPGVLPKFQ